MGANAIPGADWSEDAELARLAGRTGDGCEFAFEELVRRVHERVREWARHFTDDHDDADDVAQLVLVRLHARAREFDGKSRFTTWLYQVTRNLALDRLRTESRRAALRRRVHGWVTAGLEAESLISEEDAVRLRRLVEAYYAELPRRQREVFELVDIQGHSTDEAAQRLGISTATVRVLLHKARRRLRLRMLGDHPRLLEDYR